MDQNIHSKRNPPFRQAVYSEAYKDTVGKMQIIAISLRGIRGRFVLRRYTYVQHLENTVNSLYPVMRFLHFFGILHCRHVLVTYETFLKLGFHNFCHPLSVCITLSMWFGKTKQQRYCRQTHEPNLTKQDDKSNEPPEKVAKSSGTVIDPKYEVKFHSHPQFAVYEDESGCFHNIRILNPDRNVRYGDHSDDVLCP